MRKKKKADLNNSRTRSANAKAQEEYSTPNKVTKNRINEDRRTFVNNLAGEAKKLAKKET